MIAIDLFAGLGGFTAGAEAAGARVVWAANHWRTAVDAHLANHPHVQHECQDLMQFDWRNLPVFDLLLASPACQGHSNASQPRRNERHEVMRTTAWAVVDCLSACHPRAFIVENVPQFARWNLFRVWLLALQTLEYNVTVQSLQAGYCGVPQRRERLIIVGHRQRAISIVDPMLPEIAFQKHLSNSADDWRPIANAGDDARKRMEAASKRHGHCLVQHVTGHRGIRLDEPVRTITTKRQWCEVRGTHYRWLTPRELARAQSFEDSYVLPDVSLEATSKLIGNAFPPKMAAVAVHQVMEAA